MNKNKERVKPGAVVLDAGAGSVERTLAILEHSQPGVVITLDASAARIGGLLVTRASSKADRETILSGRAFDSNKDNEQLDAIAEEAKERLQRVIAAMSA